MTTLQEYLNQRYSDQESKEKVKEIILENKREEMKNIDGRELDLSKYANLEKLTLHGNYLKFPLTKLKLGSLPNLKHLSCSYNKLTSVLWLTGTIEKFHWLTTFMYRWHGCG